jgi:hypothetical protein
MNMPPSTASSQLQIPLVALLIAGLLGQSKQWTFDEV